MNSKSCMWIKPLKQKNITLLRAPYRYKLSRQQITITRYFIFYKLVFNFKKNFYLDTIKNCIDFTNSMKKFNIWIESNIVYQFKIKCTFKIFLKTFFFVK